MEKILFDIKNHKVLPKIICNITDIDRDDNCSHRSLSLYFTKDESFYNFFRQQIYKSSKENLENHKEIL